MARVTFTANLQRHVAAPSIEAPGQTVHQVLEAVFAKHAQLRGYVVDEQGELRKHMIVFIDGEQSVDRVKLSDPVSADANIYVMQALSGGQAREDSAPGEVDE